MNTITNIRIEWFKIKRTKTFLYSIVVLSIALLWATGASMNYLSKSNKASIKIIITSFADLNTLFLPIIISIVASKICRVEHKHQTFKYLKAIGISKGVLYKSKMSLLFFNLSIMVLLESIFIFILSTLYTLDIDIMILVKFIIGNFIAGHILNSIFLTIALKYKNRAIPLSVGVLGGFIGIIISKAPIFIKAIIPFGIINVLSPVHIHFNNELSALTYLDKKGMYTLFIIYFIVGALIYHFQKYRVNKEEY